MFIIFWLSAYTKIRSVMRIIMRLELKLNKNQITCYLSCFPKSEPWVLNFVTEKFVTSRMRLDKQMSFAWNNLNYDNWFGSIFSTE